MAREIEHSPFSAGTNPQDLCPHAAAAPASRPLFSALRSGFGRLGHVLRTAFAAGAAQVAETAQVVEAARPGEGRRSGEKEMKEVNEGPVPA